MLWIPLIAGLSVGAGVLGTRLGKMKSRWWVAGYFAPLFLVGLAGMMRWAGPGSIPEEIACLASGRIKFAVLGIAAAMLLATPAARLKSGRAKKWIAGFGVSVVAFYALMPFAWPVLMAGEYARLKTTFDRRGVCCMQTTNYTCGPASAVTALRAYRLPAEEGEIARLAFTTPTTGTQGDLLAEAIRGQYAKQGLTCEYRAFASIDELSGAGVALAEIEYSWLIGHWVAVLDVTDEDVVVADPAKGLKLVPHDMFCRLWANRGIAFARAQRENP